MTEVLDERRVFGSLEPVSPLFTLCKVSLSEPQDSPRPLFLSLDGSLPLTIQGFGSTHNTGPSPDSKDLFLGFPVFGCVSDRSKTPTLP